MTKRNLKQLRLRADIDCVCVIVDILCSHMSWNL